MADKSKKSRYVVAIIIIIVAGAILLGWVVGRHSKNTAKVVSVSKAGLQTTAASSSGVSSLVTYILPSGWSQTSCSNTPNIVYVAPSGTSPDCSAALPSPITIAVDSQDIVDCVQLQPSNAQNQVIKDHTCLSLYIDGHKTLKALTEYSAKSVYKSDTTFSDYFIDTGNGVVKAEYTYTSNNELQESFNQIVLNFKVKG